MDIKILVATHKPYRFVKDSSYVPIQVGAAINKKLDFIGDDTGDSISVKNKNYCELTALYWAWKNLDYDYCGLVHYRRYFTIDKKMFANTDQKFEAILDETMLKNTFESNDVILPKKRNYYIESTYSQYANAHNAKDLDITKDVIEELYPNYIPTFEAVMKSKKGHRFNMFIMKKDIFNEYCEWLFTILFEVEKRVDISNYDPYQSRIFGFISERLLDVFIETKKLKYIEYNVTFMEKEKLLSKGYNLVKRKIYSKK